MISFHFVYKGYFVYVQVNVSIISFIYLAMAAAQSIICTICDLRHKTLPAIVWCPECDENLCGSCKEHHDLTRLTKGHQSIKIEECNKISPIIQEIKQYCAEHNEQFIFLCPSHGTLCCRKCITSTHSQCTKFTSLEDVIDSDFEDVIEIINFISRHRAKFRMSVVEPCQCQKRSPG